MIETLRNFMAVIRGNFLCLLYGIKHKMFVRVFSGVQLNIKTNASVNFGNGVMIGRNSLITVRENAIFTMGEMSSFNADCKIACQQRITIGDNTIFGPNVLVYDHDHIFDSNGVKRNEFTTKPITIGHDCWVGAGTVILKGSTIGDRCIIGAGSIIKGDIPSGTILIQKRQDKLITINKKEAES